MQSGLVVILVGSWNIVRRVEIEEVDWLERDHHFLSRHDGEICKGGLC